MTSRDLARTSGGILDILFGGNQNGLERQHQGALSAIGREAELVEEAIVQINETGREALREVAMSAMARNQSIQIDPHGAEVYFRVWAQTAEDTQAMVHGLARRLR